MLTSKPRNPMSSPVASIWPEKDWAPLKLLMTVTPALLPDVELLPPTGSTFTEPVEMTCKVSRVLLEAAKLAASK